MIILSKEQVLKLHASLLKATGGSDGIRDEGMLDLALNNPFQSFDGKELYPSIQAKAARLCFGLVKNHAMLDGNKRLGTHVMLVKNRRLKPSVKPRNFYNGKAFFPLINH